MGTPQFGVPVLENILSAGFRVAGVYTQPDRPAGRGQEMEPPPVKKAALAHNLPVFQPETLNDAAEIAQLVALKPEVIVVAAYSHLLKKEVLGLPPRGCINLHPSLLPRYRGAAPVAGALLGGDSATGITIMLMDEGLDSGPILAQRHETILATDTTGSLTTRLADRGGKLLAETLPLWLAGEITPRPQDPSLATFTRKLEKEDGKLDWRKPGDLLWRQVRACYPWPGAFTFWNGRRLKITSAVLAPHMSAPPGQVVLLPPGHAAPVGVGTGRGVLGLLRVQVEGRAEASASDFQRGARDFAGSILG
jgi:methionyl-tRNA formyltransferase